MSHFLVLSDSLCWGIAPLDSIQHCTALVSNVPSLGSIKVKLVRNVSFLGSMNVPLVGNFPPHGSIKVHR
jgi:hypothetical protein